MKNSFLFSKLGLGTGTLASLRGGLSPTAAGRLIDAAVDQGINLIDTADSYAAGGCERLLGSLLRGRRDKFSIVTKAGYVSANLPVPLHRFNPLLKHLKHRLGPRQDFRPEYIARCLRASLKRLRTDRVEVFLLHDPTPESLSDGRLFAEMSKLKAAGLALSLGISSGDDEALRLALAWADCDVIETPLLEDGRLAATLRKSEDRPIVMLNHVSLGGRLPGPSEDPTPSVSLLQDLTSRRAGELGVAPNAALLRVALEQTGASCVLTGTRNPAHLIENCRAVFH